MSWLLTYWRKSSQRHDHCTCLTMYWTTIVIASNHRVLSHSAAETADRCLVFVSHSASRRLISHDVCSSAMELDTTSGCGDCFIRRDEAALLDDEAAPVHNVKRYPVTYHTHRSGWIVWMFSKNVANKYLVLMELRTLPDAQMQHQSITNLHSSGVKTFPVNKKTETNKDIMWAASSKKHTGYMHQSGVCMPVLSHTYSVWHSITHSCWV